MTFKKPFRAVPIKPGKRYQTKKKRKSGLDIVAFVAGSIALGVLIGYWVHIWGGNSGASKEPQVTERSLSDRKRVSAAELDAQQPVNNPVDVPASRLVGVPDTSWSYSSCKAARAAGAAPLHIGEAGYGPHLDRDGDGVACEPYYD